MLNSFRLSFSVSVLYATYIGDFLESLSYLLLVLVSSIDQHYLYFSNVLNKSYLNFWEYYISIVINRHQ